MVARLVGSPVVPLVNASARMSSSPMSTCGSLSVPSASRLPNGSRSSPSRAAVNSTPFSSLASAATRGAYRALANTAFGSARPSRVSTSASASRLLSGT